MKNQYQSTRTILMQSLRKIHVVIAAIIGITLFLNHSSQAQSVSDFEDLNLGNATYYDGADQAGNFVSNGVEFYNAWDTAWGGFWGDGFAYTNMTDDTTGTFVDPYSTFAGYSMGDSGKFVVALAQQFYQTHLKISGGSKVAGFHVSNNTYAALSMLNGDSFGKKFGELTNANGEVDSTNGEDWFKLTIAGFMNGSATSNVEFYLADYRYGNDSLDYIIKDWTWVDLTSLGTVDSIRFYLGSSDFAGFGINTPGYFCMDNFTLLDSTTKTILDFPMCQGAKTSLLGDSISDAVMLFDTITADSVVAYNVSLYLPVHATIDLPTSLCVDSSITLISNVSSSLFSGTGVDGNTFNASDSLITIGLNEISMTYIDSNSCNGTYTGTLEVVLCGGGGTTDGIAELSKEDVKIYPSITHSELFIEMNKTVWYSVSITDLNGRTVMKDSESPSLLMLNKLGNGVYVVQVATLSGAYSTRIIKQ